MLPGEAYGRALNVAPTNVALRERMDAVARRIGANTSARAGIGEAFLTSSIFPADEAGEMVPRNFARDGELDPNAWGYDVAAVVAESEDGQIQVTLENHARRPDLSRAVRRAIEQNLQRHAGRFSQLRQRLVEQAGTEQDPRIALVDTLRTIEQFRADHPTLPPELSSELDRLIDRASAQLLALLRDELPSHRQLWHVGMYGPHTGETFHESRARLRPEQDVPRLANPLTVVVLGGDGTAGLTEVRFAPGRRGIDGAGTVGRNRIAAWARWYVRQATWRARNGARS